MGQVSRGCPRWSAIAYMSSGMFRGKESSNRIELFWLVQELLNFCVLGSLQLWGWGGWVDGGGGWLGVPHTHMHTHAHAPIGGIHENSQWYHTHMCVRACACICMCVGGTPSPPPPPSTHPPTPQRGDPQNQSKFNSTWTNRDISILFEDLKSVETSSPQDGCVVWWVGGWVGGSMGGVRSNY